jgi:hypothetical protein
MSDLPKGAFVASDGRIVGVLYGQLFDLVAQMCVLLGLKLESLDIVLANEDVERPEAVQWLRDYVDGLPGIKRQKTSVVAVKVDAEISPMIELLRSYYGAIQGDMPSKSMVVTEAVKTLYMQNQSAIEKLVQVTMEQQQHDSS